MYIIHELKIAVISRCSGWDYYYWFGVVIFFLAVVQASR